MQKIHTQYQHDKQLICVSCYHIRWLVFKYFSERGYIHPELRVVLQMSSLTASIAALFGAVSGAKEARETFVEKHKLTKWKTKFIAAVCLKLMTI